MEMENMFIPMVLYMLGNSKMIKLTEMEKSKDLMEPRMTENGLRICNMEMENRF